MGRPVRIQFPGACYYIILQGNNRQNIFLSNQDRRFFLGLLGAYKERFGLKIYAYCLLDNQVQLLLETVQQPLARVMQAFNTVYTKHFNKQHHLVGHVLRGRYKAFLVEKPDYLMEMTYYIHLEPGRAGLKEKPWRYLWSSCAAYVEGAEREPMIDSDFLLKLMGKNRLKQSVEYLKVIKERMKSADKPSFEAYRGRIGSRDFTASPAPPGAPAWESSSQEKAQKIIDEVLAKGLGKENLFGAGRKRDLSLVRRQAVHRIWKEAKLGVSDLGRMFHRTPSAITQMIQAMEATGNLE